MGFGYVVLLRGVLRRPACPVRASATAFLGFCLGTMSSTAVHSHLADRFDQDIINAFDQRYARRSLNANMLRNDHISMKLTDVMAKKKPY